MPRGPCRSDLAEITPVILADRALARSTAGSWIAEIDTPREQGLRAARLRLIEGPTWQLEQIIGPSGIAPFGARVIVRARQALLAILARHMDALGRNLRETGSLTSEIIATRNFCTVITRDAGSILRPSVRDFPQGSLLEAAGCEPASPLLILYDRRSERGEFTASAQAHRLREIADEISLVADVALTPCERLATKIHLC